MDLDFTYEVGETHHMLSGTGLHAPDPQFESLTGMKRVRFGELLRRMQSHRSTRPTIEQAKHLLALCVFLQSGCLKMYYSFCPGGPKELDEAICQEFSTAFDLIEDAVENEAVYWAKEGCRMPGKIAELDYDHYKQQNTTIMALCGPRGQIYKTKAVKWPEGRRPTEAKLLEASGWLEYFETLPVFVFRGLLLPAYITTDRGPASVRTWCHPRIVMPQIYVHHRDNTIRVPNLQRIICPGMPKQRERVKEFLLNYKSVMGERVHLLTEKELELSMFWVGIASIQDITADRSVRRLSTRPARECRDTARKALKELWTFYGGAEEFIIEIHNAGLRFTPLDKNSVFYDVPEEMRNDESDRYVKKARTKSGRASLEDDLEVYFDGDDEEWVRTEESRLASFTLNGFQLNNK